MDLKGPIAFRSETIDAEKREMNFSINRRLSLRSHQRASVEEFVCPVAAFKKAEDRPHTKRPAILRQNSACRAWHSLYDGQRLFLARKTIARQRTFGKHDKPGAVFGGLAQPGAHHFKIERLVSKPAVHLHAGDFPE